MRNENLHILCDMTFFHICIILHVINKFYRKIQFFAFFQSLIFANVATLCIKNIERPIQNIFRLKPFFITFVV